VSKLAWWALMGVVLVAAAVVVVVKDGVLALDEEQWREMDE
jgi:hypothetical protein